MYDVQIILTTRELRTFLPTLKLSFDKNLNSHVVYKITCNGCVSIFIGQTIENVTTRIPEHQKKNFPVGQQLVECCGTAHNFEWEILDTCRRGIEKLMTIEATYIKKLKPQLNKRNEYRGGNCHWSFSWKIRVEYYKGKIFLETKNGTFA